MLIIALVLAVIGLAALVFAVVTSNELVAWVCIAASILGVVLLTVDALRERRRRGISPAEAEQPDIPEDTEYPDDDDDLALYEADEADDVTAVPEPADAQPGEPDGEPDKTT